MERRGADGQGTVGKTYSLHTQRHALTQDTICVPWRCLWMRACPCPPHFPSSTSLCLSLSAFTHMLTRTHTLPFLLEDANITHDKAPVDSSQTKHFLSKAVHLYAEPIQRIAKAGVSWKAWFSPAFSHSRCLFSLTSLAGRLITLMFEDIRLVINCSPWYWIGLPVYFDKSAVCDITISPVCGFSLQRNGCEAGPSTVARSTLEPSRARQSHRDFFGGFIWPCTIRPTSSSTCLSHTTHCWGSTDAGTYRPRTLR